MRVLPKKKEETRPRRSKFIKKDSLMLYNHIAQSPLCSHGLVLQYIQNNCSLRAVFEQFGTKGLSLSACADKELGLKKKRSDALRTQKYKRAREWMLYEPLSKSASRRRAAAAAWPQPRNVLLYYYMRESYTEGVEIALDYIFRRSL